MLNSCILYVCMHIFVSDAAHSALYVKNVQFFYDEIEAELNLAIDQVYHPIKIP